MVNNTYIYWNNKLEKVEIKVVGAIKQPMMKLIMGCLIVESSSFEIIITINLLNICIGESDFSRNFNK